MAKAINNKPVGRKPTDKAEVIRKALNDFPNTSNRAIANYLVETYPTIFTDVEKTRKHIQKYTAPSSSDRPNWVKASKFTPDNPYGLPESLPVKESFYRIPKVNNRILWMSDIHFPNHDQQALTVAIDYGKDKDVNCIVLGGDVLDNTPFTSFLHAPFNKV